MASPEPSGWRRRGWPRRRLVPHARDFLVIGPWRRRRAEGRSPGDGGARTRSAGPLSNSASMRSPARPGAPCTAAFRPIAMRQPSRTIGSGISNGGSCGQSSFHPGSRRSHPRPVARHGSLAVPCLVGRAEADHRPAGNHRGPVRGCRAHHRSLRRFRPVVVTVDPTRHRPAGGLEAASADRPVSARSRSDRRCEMPVVVEQYHEPLASRR